MKIAYLIGQFPAINHGYLLQEIHWLRELGIEVRTVSINTPDRPLEELSAEEREEAGSTLYIKAQSVARVAKAHLATLWSRPRSYLHGLAQVFSDCGGPGQFLRQMSYFIEAVVLGDWMLRERMPALYINFSLDAGRMVSEMFPVAAVLAIHGFGELAGAPQGRLGRTIRAMKLVRCISRYNQSETMLSCRPADGSKIVYLPLGIDAALWKAQSQREFPDPFRLTYTGRMAPEKGQSILLEAIAKLRQNGRNVRLHLVGEGPDRPALERQTVRQGISDWVVFEGRIDNHALFDYYRATDVFVLTSLFEGIPIVLMEAMAMGIPCVAPSITGIPELITHESSGLLFPPADVDSLVRAIERLMDDAELRRKLGANGRERVLREYDLRRNTIHFAKVLEEL